mgnify:CR=1 FL=1|jgi:hypothetical protein
MATLHKNITYYPDRATAHGTMAMICLMKGITTARVVEYTLGYAIQKHKSGPYWNHVKNRFE